MSNTLLSIFTLYNYNKNIFDNMVIPEGLEKDVLIDNLLTELAEFEVLYADPNFMQLVIGSWSRKELKVWQDLYNTTMLDYNPIENYNRTETGTDSETRNLSKTDQYQSNIVGSDNEVRDLKSTGSDKTIVDSEINRSGEDSRTTSASAFNESDTFTDREKETTTFGSKEETDSSVNVDMSGTDTGSVNTTRTNSESRSNTESDSGTISHQRNSNIKGNIGVTTTQQMIEQERAVVLFNVYDYIINSFKMRFCITVY